MHDARQAAQRVEDEARLPTGSGERFTGYGVMAAPFRSGHLLAMRRFAASSIGPAYSSVWHRSPQGRWTFWTDTPPLQACPRYFGAAITTSIQADISIVWDGPDRFHVSVPSAALDWSLQLRTTAATRLMSWMAGLMPQSWWASPRVLKAMAALAGKLLRADRLGLQGQTPNGQHFVVNPMQVWIIDRSEASIAGEDLGAIGPLPEQVRLGDFWIPQRALFAVGRAFFEESDPQRHVLLASAPRPSLIDQHQTA